MKPRRYWVEMADGEQMGDYAGFSVNSRAEAEAIAREDAETILDDLRSQHDVDGESDMKVEAEYRILKLRVVDDQVFRITNNGGSYV